MTKTLTEQLREGTLPLNHYYVKTKSGRYGIDNTVLTFDEEKPITKLLYSDYTEEVLSSVPSYDEYNDLIQQNVNKESAIETYIERIKELEKKLEIATKALNGIRDVWANNPNKFSYIARIANRKAKIALEEIEGGVK